MTIGLHGQGKRKYAEIPQMIIIRIWLGGNLITD
jgi:hypothetical protein